MMKKALVCTPILVTIAILVLIFKLATIQATVSLPVNTTIERSGVWLQNATEASGFIWSNDLYYVFTDRNASGSQKQMKIVKFSDNSTVSTFGSGYGYQDVVVDSGTLYIFATDGTGNGNHIVYFSTTDLTNFSGPTVIKTMDASTQVFNVSAVKGGSNFVVAYEMKTTGQASFGIKFTQSSNLTTWTDTGSMVGGSWQASCPDLIYDNGTYYMYVGTTPPGERLTYSGGSYTDITVYAEYLGKSTDLSSWSFSSIYTLYPQSAHNNDMELFHKIVNGTNISVKNNTDLDLVEFQGKTYIFYMIGNQLDTMELTYATFSGTIDQLLNLYYR